MAVAATSAENGVERPDEELIAAYRETGQQDALDTLVRRHVGRVRSMIAQMVLSEADADDLTQEVFLRAVRGLSGFRGRARFSTWLYRIAMNVARSFIRTKRTSAADTWHALAGTVDARSVPAEDNAIAGELQARISEAMAALPPALRAAIVLTAVQGLEAKEAAKVQGCSTALFYWRLHKARKVLRKRLGKFRELKE